nr:HupE/UreJ family protein [Myxococcota bacterium]
AYVRGWLAVAPAGPGSVACPPGEATARAGADPRFVVVAWDVTCPAVIEALRVDLTAFFALDVRHEAIVTVHGTTGSSREPAIARATTPVLVLAVGARVSFLAWIGYGLDHIYGGLDHVCFVLALLLVVVLARSGPGAAAGWQLRPPLAALRATAVIVTGFTVAHSVSLIAASLGWVAVPSRLVESLIAASIIYTAIENVVHPATRWRLPLTIGFGLVHGLGFASMLGALLPPGDVLLPLVGFNLGVELGQLSIVIVALPVLWLVAWAVGAGRYRRVGLAVAAVPLVAIGVHWLLERM